MATAWVANVLYSLERVDLADEDALMNVAGAADFLNHAVLGYDELVRALAALEARGWLLVEGSVCALAPEARSAIEREVGAEETPFLWSFIETCLARTPPFREPYVPHVDPEKFARATNRYLKRMDDLLAKMRK